MASRTLLKAGSVVCALTCAGCAGSTPSPSSAPLVSKTQEQNWDRALSQLSGAWQKSAAQQKTPTAPNAASVLPLVTIDLKALATHHPAWRLADALEANRLAALDFAALRVADFASPQMSTPHFDVHFEEKAATRQARSSEEAAPLNDHSAPEAQARAAVTVSAHGLEALATQAADRQSDEMENFRRAGGARQWDARRQYAQIRRVALEHTVEAVRATPLPELTPPLLSDAEQLAVTNLRLQLLGNVFSTQETRARAQAQLDKILAEWQARLRAQEKARAAELQRRLVEEPQQARAAGEADLRRDLDRLQREQRALLQLIWQQHEARVQRDLGDAAARLTIVLPPVSPHTAGSADASTPASASGAPEFIETKLPPLPSLGALATNETRGDALDSVKELHLALSSSERIALVRSLRAQAWREARNEAQWAARRFGWRWQPATSQHISAPDRTGEVLQWLSD